MSMSIKNPFKRIHNLERAVKALTDTFDETKKTVDSTTHRIDKIYTLPLTCLEEFAKDTDSALRKYKSEIRSLHEETKALKKQIRQLRYELDCLKEDETINR